MTIPNRRIKRVLVVAYVFPPTGGAGVQRVTKFVRYLPEVDWDCSVLTVANPSVPVRDNTLLEEIPDSTIIRRARTYEPGYKLKNAVSAGATSQNSRGWRSLLKRAVRTVGNALFQPDAQVLWYPNAIREGKRLLRELHHDAILVTAPPFSPFLVGPKLSEVSGLPLILDYRDEWGISNRYQENRQKSRLSHWIQSRQQRKVLKAARSVIATTRRSADSLRELIAQTGTPATVSCIYNGYDQQDVDQHLSARRVETSGSDAVPRTDQSTRTFRLAYVGTLWNLTSIEPIVEAIKLIASTEPKLLKQLELTIAGRQTGEQDAILNRLNDLPCRVSREGYVSHERAIEIMNSADSLALLLSDVPEASRVMPAKTFEYMALQKPILNVGPVGEVTEVVADCPYAESFVPSDTLGIANYLRAGIRGELGADELRPDAWTPEKYERRALTQQLANVLDYAISDNRKQSDRPIYVPEEFDSLIERGPTA